MKNRIRILATSDLHGYLFAHTDSSKKEKDMGIAKIATMVSSLRDENTILVDNGDSFVGSNFSFYHELFEKDKPNPVSLAMKDMDYDFVNLGNQDFNFGEESLLKHLDTINAPCITTNISYHGKPFTPNYVVKEVDGYKVCLFGLITQATSSLEDRKALKNFRFKDVIETAKKTTTFIKRFEKPDYIICLYHGGFESDLQTGLQLEFDSKENVGYRLLREVPYIDVLISGHQHKTLASTLFKTTYVQTPSKGEGLACIDIYTDTQEIEAQILPADMEEDPHILSIGNTNIHAYYNYLEQPLATCDVDLSVKDPFEDRLHKPQLVTFFNNLQKEIMNTDLSAYAIPNHCDGLQKEITTQDLMNAYQLQTCLVKKEITGKTLREYLEKCAEFFCIEHEYITISPDYQTPRKKYYNYDMVDGVEYTMNIKNDRGQRITSLTYQGQEVSDDMVFTIALSAKRANGAGNFKMLKHAKTLETSDLPAVELMRQKLLEKQTIHFDAVNNIKVEKV